MSRREAEIIIAEAAIVTATAVVAGVKVKGGLDLSSEPAGVDTFTREFYPDTVTEIVEVEGTNVERPPYGAPRINPWVAFGGLGRQHNGDQASMVAEELLGEAAPWVKVGGFNYANQGIELDHIAVCLDEFTRGYDGINVFGHSMGSLTALEALTRMKRPVHVDTFVALSSPSGRQDVYRQRELEEVVESGADGDILEKFIFRLATDNRSDRRDFFGKIFDIVGRAAEETSKGVSPKVYVDALRIIYWARLAIVVSKLVSRGMITPKTKFYYLKSPEGRDGTVKARQACDTYGDCLRGYKVPFEEVEFDGGHAESRIALEKLKDLYWEYLASLESEDGEDAII